MVHDQSDAVLRQETNRSFPGGRVRLPRLSGEDRSETPRIDVVETAFVGGGTATLEAGSTPPAGGFTSYFTAESLFTAPEPDDDLDPVDPYAVLKVTRDMPWSEIQSVHRALVKQFHPDRFVGHPAEVVALAEIEIKRINRAYSELRRQNSGVERRRGADRRSGG